MLTIAETEKLLKQYFTDLTLLRIHKNSTINYQKQIEQLTASIKALDEINFNADVKSPVLQEFTPLNRQPAKGLDSFIDKQAELQYKYTQQIQELKYEILTAQEKVICLERQTKTMQDIFNLLEQEAQQLIKYKYQDKKSFEFIGNMTNRSPAAVYDYYRKILCDICKWLNHLNKT